MRISILAVLMFLVSIGCGFAQVPDVTNCVKVKWTQANPGEQDGHRIYVEKDGVNQTPVDVTPGNILEIDCAALPITEGASYVVKVAAYNATGESLQGNAAAFNFVMAPPPPPPVPSPTMPGTTCVVYLENGVEVEVCDDGTAPPPPPPSGAHAYFDLLSARSDMIVSNDYRSQTMIDRDSAGDGANPDVSYDASQDAAMATHAVDQSGISVAGQVRPSFDNTGYAKNPQIEILTGNLLITWDAKWGTGFLDTTNDGLTSQKVFQLSRMADGDKRRLEVRTRFSLSDSSYIAKMDNRSYIWGHAGSSAPMGAGGCNGADCQIAGFDLQVETWTRFWCYVDFDNGTYSFWMADQNAAPVKLFDEFVMDFNTGLNAFWFEYNSSAFRTGPEIYAWFRNFVVLQNVVSAAEVDSIVQSGSLVPISN